MESPETDTHRLVALLAVCFSLFPNTSAPVAADDAVWSFVVFSLIEEVALSQPLEFQDWGRRKLAVPVCVMSVNEAFEDSDAELLAQQFGCQSCQIGLSDILTVQL